MNYRWPHMKVVHKNSSWMSPETLNPDGTGYYKVRFPTNLALRVILTNTILRKLVLVMYSALP